MANVLFKSDMTILVISEVFLIVKQIELTSLNTVIVERRGKKGKTRHEC